MKRIVLAFLAAIIAVLPANAQRISSQQGSSATSYMLDGQTASSGAYSLRRVLTSYSTNKLINIVRASDSTTTDIGFTATGAFDTATALTFCAATTCKVVTWYDQSGNARDITQATDGNRPSLIFNCLGTMPCVQFTGTTQALAAVGNVTPATGVVSFSTVGNRVSGTGNCTWIRENGNNNRMLATNGQVNAWQVNGGASGSVSAAATDAVWHSGIGVVNGASSILSIDGTETTGTTTGNTTAAAPGMLLTVSSTCYVVSSIFWDNVALDATARTAITNNQQAWWGLGSTTSATLGLDLDFANSRYYQQGVPACVSPATCITVSRASTGYADDTTGTWTSFGNNIARVTDKGLLVEEARTNGIRNNSMQGAAAGSPGTLPTNWQTNEAGFTITRTISLGTQNGIDYIELNYTGTPGASGTLQIRAETITGTTIPGSAGQTWSSSAFASNSSSVGVATVRPAILGVNNAGTQQEALTGTIFTGDTAFSRRAVTLLMAAAGTVSINGDIRASLTSGTPINYTLRIGWPQIEQGTYASSPIRTTAAAVARAADVPSLTTAMTYGTAYTLYGKATPNALVTSAVGQDLIEINDTTANNVARLQRLSATGNPGILGISAGTSRSASPATVWAQSASGAAAGAFADSDMAMSFNGGTVAVPTANALPVGVTTLNIGVRQTGAGQWNGFISRVSVWPGTRLSNAVLQELTR